MNRKGFALTETLVVVVFLVSIFTFIYISVMPLMGKYEDEINSAEDLDIVYKLYHIRKTIMTDENRKNITKSEVSQITCNNLSISTFCNKLMEQMELRNDNNDNYVIIYAKALSDNNLGLIKNINTEIGEYATKHKTQITKRVLFLLDTKKHTIGYLYYDDTR